MPVPSAEIEGASIVLVGNFNPAIFQPSWLGTHGIIRPGEAEGAKINLISPEVTSFSTEWLALQSTRDRFQVSTSDVRYFDRLVEVVLSAFTLLEHTPVHKLGINRDMHFPASIEYRNRFAEILAPKVHWRSLLEEPLLETLIMQGRRENSRAKLVRITIQPSLRVQLGIYIGSNEHFEVEGEQTPQKILRLLADSWTGAQTYAKGVAEDLLSQAE